MNPLKIETSEDLFEVVKQLPFADKVVTTSLWAQFQMFTEWTSAQLGLLIKDGLSCTDTKACNTTIYLLKTFVHDKGAECSDLARLYVILCTFPCQ